MKLKMKQGLKLVSIGILTSLLLSTFSGVYARDNWAYAAGLKYDVPDNIFDFDSIDECNNALTAYNNAGFSVGGDINPDKATLWKNLYATVQYFFGHGGVDFIFLGNTGIINGEDMTTTVTADNGKSVFSNVPFIGTNTVHWYADTDLVSYFSCNGAGENGEVTSDSLARSTCVRGATVVLGFTTEVHTLSLEKWSNRYNEKLGQGYGVDDAVKYANSFNYMFNDVKNVTLWNHGDANIKIGKYGSSSKNYSTSEQNIKLNADDSIKERLVYSSNGLKTTKISSNSDIENKLSEIYQKFDSSNYIIEKNTSYCYDVNTNLPTEEKVYYDYKLKIGDYITDAGYTVIVENNMITEIYDNNIDLKEQEELLNKNFEFEANICKEDIESYKLDLNKKIIKKYDNKIDIVENEHTFYYDIENNKKYVVINCESEIKFDSVSSGKTIDYAMYEI